MVSTGFHVLRHFLALEVSMKAADVALAFDDSSTGEEHSVAGDPDWFPEVGIARR